MMRRELPPPFATETPPTAVQRMAQYFERAALLNARAALDPDHDPRIDQRGCNES